jgi:hypothetical protein
MKPDRTLFPILAGLWILGAPASGETLTLNPSADTTLWEANPNANEGASGTLVVGGTPRGRARGLMRFNLDTLPAGAVVSEARLVLQITRQNVQGPQLRLRLHRIQRAWGEGDNEDGTGSQAAGPGEASWNAPFHGTDTWSVPGGESGSDFHNSVTATLLLDATGEYSTVSSEVASDVRSWISNPASNHGWLLFGAEESIPRSARRIASREGGVQAPRLVLTYSVPVEPTRPVLVLGPSGPDAFTFQFQAEGDTMYEVRSSPMLPMAGNETVLTHLLNRFVPTNALVRAPLGGGSRFFRVVATGQVD